MGTISRNFSYHEFEASGISKSKGIVNKIDSDDVRNAIRALVLNVLQPLRDHWGAPLQINSGFRCLELNRAVGGVPTSQHLKGEAADVACSEPHKLASLALRLKLPFDQIILYPAFVHFSYRNNGQQRGEILYSSTYKGLKL